MKEHDKAPSDIVETYAVEVENFHHIARDILARLYTHDRVSYAELKPRELTGNAFNYHLRHVMAQKLVETDDQGKYRLGSAGRLLLDSVSLETMRLKLRPVAGVMIAIRSERLGLLAYESNREPIRGAVGLPFGKLRLGDTVQSTLERIIERRGLHSESVTGLTCLGNANIRYFADGELVSHRNLTVWSGLYDGPEAMKSTHHGSSMWVDMDNLPAHVLAEIPAVVGWPQDQNLIEVASDLIR